MAVDADLAGLVGGPAICMARLASFITLSDIPPDTARHKHVLLSTRMPTNNHSHTHTNATHTLTNEWRDLENSDTAGMSHRSRLSSHSEKQ